MDAQEREALVAGMKEAFQQTSGDDRAKFARENALDSCDPPAPCGSSTDCQSACSVYEKRN